MEIRYPSEREIPSLRKLWKQAFGDTDAYLDLFFTRGFDREKSLCAMDGDQVAAAMYWLDAEYGGKQIAYLYAVATHPAHRGLGLSGRLLAWADDHFRTLNIPAVTTVPATPSLHNFFAANGFRECFCHDELLPTPNAHPLPCTLHPISPAGYSTFREEFLSHSPHIRLPEDAIRYQDGCSRISGGGLYAAEAPSGRCILCAEGMEDGTLLVKELLGQPSACDEIMGELHRILPGFSGICRRPGSGIPFGMLKWLDKFRADVWNWHDSAYLGLAFD